jgi:hypothetical protein
LKTKTDVSITGHPFWRWLPERHLAQSFPVHRALGKRHLSASTAGAVV